MKQWVNNNLILLVFLLLAILTLNVFMDPFWCYSYNHPFNSVQKATNERQQKANFLYFSHKQFDTLILGSSRTSYMNRHTLKNMEAFNFAAPDMLPREYLTYIDFAIHDCHQPLQKIILGIDFFGYLSYDSSVPDISKNVIQSTLSPYYRYRILLSYDAFATSLKNLKHYFNPDNNADCYNRDNVKTSLNHPSNMQNFDDLIAQSALYYANLKYNTEKNKDYEATIQNIKDSYPDLQFIVFTTPVSKELMQQLIKTGHYQDYEKWLVSLVRTFGKVYHFMYINSVTIHTQQYFADSHHAYPETYRIIADKLTEQQSKVSPKDFGILLTPENIKLNLKNLRQLNGYQ